MPQHESARNPKLNVSQRRAHNRKLARKLADAGIAIFPSSGKTPLIPGWTQLDDLMSREEIDAATARYRNGHGNEPLHVGATIDAETIEKIWQAFPDAVPSISCGANGFLVLDADQKRNGPAQLLKWAEQAGVDLSQCPTTRTQSGGLHVYLRNDAVSPLGNAAGALGDMGVDVRGAGGQVVAPGAIREDGRVYVAEVGTPDLANAILFGTVPPIPDNVRALIGSRSKTMQTVRAEDERAAIERLATQDWPDFADMTDSTIGKFDLDALAEKDAEFAHALLEPDEDRSRARFNLAKCLHREYGDTFSVLDFAALLEQFNDELDGAFGVYVGDDNPNQGEFSNRSLARDFLRSKNDRRVSDGAAFGVVEGENDNDESDAPQVYLDKKAEKVESGFRVRSARDRAAKFQPIEWTVKKIIPRRGLGLLVGDSNVGKTFLALDLADKLALGQPWLDQPTKQAGVLYVPGEGEQGIDPRLKAINTHRGALGDFGVYEGVVNLFDEGDATASKIIKGARAHEAASGLKMGLVILDTLASIAPGMDENTAKDIGVVLRHARKIERRLKCAVLIVHHLGKKFDAGIRGSSALRGNTDFVLMASEGKVQRKGPTTTFLSVDKQRDGSKGACIPFRLETVVIGQDVSWNPDKPEDITSCVVVTPSESLSAVEDQEDAADLGQGPQTAEPKSPIAQPDERANLSERQRRVLDLAQGMGGPFTGRDIHTAYNRTWGRKDKPLGVDTIRRCLQTLRDAYLAYNEYDDTSLNRWSLIQDGESGLIQGSQ